MSLKNSNETIGNRTRDLPVCSVVLAAKVLLPNDNKTHKWQSKHNSFYSNLQPEGYMFRLLRFIIRPSFEPTQDYLIHSALRDPVALTIGSVIVVYVHVSCTDYSILI